MRLAWIPSNVPSARALPISCRCLPRNSRPTDPTQDATTLIIKDATAQLHSILSGRYCCFPRRPESSCRAVARLEPPLLQRIVFACAPAF